MRPWLGIAAACLRRSAARAVAVALATLGGAAAGQTPTAAGAASAEPPSQAEQWKLSGFGTLGWLHASSELPWTYARDLTQKGAAGAASVAVDSRLALQLRGTLSTRVEVVAQLVLKERPIGARADEALEWAFLGWRPEPDTKVRLGRTSPDLFLLADVRNVGFAYPWVRPSVEYYGWMPFASMDGADLTVPWRTDLADWKGKLALGRIRATIGVTSRSDSVRIDGLDTVAATVTRESGGLLLKASFLRTTLRAADLPEIEQLRQGLVALSALPVQPVADDAARLLEVMQFGGPARYLALGAQFDSAGWTVSAEASRVQFSRGLGGGDRGYLSAGYRHNRVTWFVMGARSLPQTPAVTLGTDWAANLAPVIGDAAAQQTAQLGVAAVALVNQPRFDQSTRSAGLRWDVHDKLALKLQLDRTRIHPYGAAAWRDSTVQSNRARVVSITADAVF